MKFIALFAIILCGGAYSATTELPCDPTPGRTAVLSRNTQLGNVEMNLDVHALGETAFGSETFKVVCGEGSEAVGKGETCLDCKPSVATSTATTSGLSGIVAPKTSTVQLRRTDGDVTTGQLAVQTQGATVLANEANILDDTVYFDSALTKTYVAGDGSTPTRGQLRSGLVHGVANAWKPGATGSATVDASAYAGDDTAFIVSFDSLDFGDKSAENLLTNLDIDLSGDDGVNKLPSFAASGGASGELVIDTAKRAAEKKTHIDLVTRVCPILIKSKKLTVQLRSPDEIPSTVDALRRDKIYYKESGSADAESVHPRGMVMRWSAIHMDDLQADIDSSITEDVFNRMTATGDVKDAIKAYIFAQTGQDPDEPCLDIMQAGASVPAKRNWAAGDHDADCTDTGYMLSGATWASCWSCDSCRSTFDGLDAATQLQDIKDYLEQCPTQGATSTSGLQAVGGWGSDKCDAAHAEKYCRGRAPYKKVDGDDGNSPPQYHISMTVDECGKWACTQEAGRPECHGLGAGTALRFTPTGGGTFTENDPNWPKGCYVYTDSNGGKKTYFNQAATGTAQVWAADPLKTTEVVYISEAAKYGYNYEKFCGATCMKCMSGSGRRSGLRTGDERDTPTVAAATSEADQALRATSLAEERALPSPEIYDFEEQKALDVAQAGEYRKTGRNLLSTTNTWYTDAKTSSEVKCGDVSVFNGMGVIGGHCDGTCAFTYTRPWCQPDSTGTRSAYSNARGIGCYAASSSGNQECAKKPQCMQSTFETDFIDDNVVAFTKTVATTCADKCKAAHGRACKYTDADCHKRNQANKNADQGACLANGACEFFEAGRCFDHFPTYFTARAASAMPADDRDKHGSLAKLELQSEVDKAISTGLVCPNEDPRQCGTKDIHLQYDRDDADATQKAEAEARTCEALPLINPASVEGAHKTLHPYDGGYPKSIRFPQAQNLPCLAFRQCGYTPSRGCYTKTPTDCVAAKKAAMSCDDNTQTSEWREHCDYAAERICNNFNNEEDVISPGFESSKHMKTEKTRQAVAESIANFRDMMSQLRKANTIFGLTQDQTMTTQLNLVAQQQQYAACVALEVDDSTFGSMSLAEKAAYYTSVGKRVECVEKLLAYAKAKLVAEYGAVGDGKASETIKLTVESSMGAYTQSGWARQGNVVRVDFCSAAFNNGGMKDSTEEFGALDDQLVALACPTGMQHKKTYVSLDNLWMFVMDANAAESTAENKFLMLAGDIQVSGAATQLCSVPDVGFNPLGLPSGYTLDRSYCASANLRSIQSNIPLYSQVVFEVVEGGGSGSRRLLSTGDSDSTNVCPPGSYYAGVHVGPRCWNAHVTNQYFAPGTTLEDGVCMSPALNEANVDGVPTCLNGMKTTECASPAGVGNSEQIYWRLDGDSQNNWYATNAKCLAAVPLEIEAVGKMVESESSKILTAVADLDEKIGDAKCFTGSDAQSKGAIKTLYQNLGNCPGA